MKFTAQRVLPLAIAALAIALLGASSVPDLPLPTSGAMIYNPGTGDYSGFRIVVLPDGRAVAIDGAGHTATQLENDVVSKFFNDLSSAGPLGQLSSRPCSADVDAPTTVEVNASITISYKGQRSPALTCATDGAAQRLLLDATAIQHALYVQAYRKRNLVTYGTAYNSPGYQYASGGYANFSPSDGYLPSWQNGFQMDSLHFDHFSNGISTANPFYGSPYSGAPTASLPYAATPMGSLPYTSLPQAYPWASPDFSSPFTSLPYGSLPTSNPFSGSSVFTTSVP